MHWIETGQSWLGSTSIWGLFVSIILLSYLLEDLAIITAALLAADNAMPVPYALFAIFIGIASGDIGLYALGVLSSRWRGLRYRLLSNRKMRLVRAKLTNKPIVNIAIIRFVPGLRTLGFTLSGLFRVRFIYFFISVLAATAAWTAVVFYCIYELGSARWIQDSDWKWAIVPVALALLWIFNRTSSNKHNSNRDNGVSA